MKSILLPTLLQTDIQPPFSQRHAWEQRLGEDDDKAMRGNPVPLCFGGQDVFLMTSLCTASVA